jgi:hypothetical protein
MGCTDKDESGDYENLINELNLYTGFDDLPENLTIDAAIQNSYFIIKESSPYANEYIWHEFYERANDGETCNIHIVSFDEEDRTHPYYIDIYYHAGLYSVFTSSTDENKGEQYKYLQTLEGMTGNPSKKFSEVVLSNKEDLTLEEHIKAMTSSLSTTSDELGSVFMLMFEVVEDVKLLNLQYTEPKLATDKQREIESSYETDTNYIELEDVSTGEVITIQCDYRFEYGASPIVAVHPEGYLVGSFRSLDSSSVKLPVMMLLDENGNIIWEEVYDYSYTTGNMSNLIAYEDGRFLFTLSNWPESSLGAPNSVPSLLIQCNSKGKVNYVKEFSDTIGSILKYVLLTEEEEIYIIGETQNNLLISSSNNNCTSDINLIKLNNKGDELLRVQYGGISNEYLKNCKYIKGVGIVFTGWSLSTEGEFAIIDNSSDWQDYIALVNLELEIEWINHIEADEKFIYDQLQLNNQSIYILGNHLTDNTRDSLLKNHQLFIIKYDVTGEEIFKTYCVEHNNYQGVMSVDRFNKIVVGSGNYNKGMLSYYDSLGDESFDSLTVNYVPHNLIPTDRGGYVVKSIREIASIPQPIFISSLWFDHEVLVEEYDSINKLIWRKVFNDYDDLRVDYIRVLDNQR